MRDVAWILLTEGRVSFRRLGHEFGLSAEQLEALRFEFVELKGWATVESGDVLTWAHPSAALQAQAVTRSHPVGAAAEPGAPKGPETKRDQILPGAERRQLTVMFCDLVGSTALSARLDPEDMQNVIGAYHAAVGPVIAEYDGFIAKYMGDGILIYFGYPQAQETDAERAVLAGLAIVGAMPALNSDTGRSMGIDLAVRIGIATGLVVVGETVGEGAARERTVVGETPNLADRLQGLARPNGIVISSLTRELVGEAFDIADLGSHQLKGIDGPVGAWQVTGERDQEFEGETAGARAVLPLVGRREELGLLARAWQQSKDGAGQVVSISGEAGIGKSRLVEAISAQVRDDGFTRITLRCSPYHRNSALYPLITHLQRVIGWETGDDAAIKLAKLEMVIATYRFPTGDTVPLIAALFSLPLPEEKYLPLSYSPPQQRLHTLDAIVAWLLEEAERRPVLQVWEDIHWADPTTLELLELTHEQCPTVSVLNVMTFRPEFTPTWTNRSHMVPLTLNRLERPEVEALITHHAGGKALPDEVVEHIVARGDGVPLYVGELTRAILASDTVHQIDDRYELSGPLGDMSIPATLQDSLMARLDRLPTVREIAQLGAVLGREFAYETLRAVADIEEPSLRDGLGQLVEAELLYQRGRPPRSRYMFKHALIQDAAYQSLLRRTRQRYHQQVAELLVGRFPELVQTHPETLARHFSEAGFSDQAVTYWLEAGRLALQRSANQEAIGHLNQGLEQVDLLPDGRQQARQELAIQRMLGTALMAAKGYAAPETVRTFNRARELCGMVEDDDSVYPVLFGVWVAELTKANHHTALEVAEELITRAARTTAPAPTLVGNAALGFSHGHMGTQLQARAHLDKAIDHYEAMEPDARTALTLGHGLDVGVAALSYQAWTVWLSGYPEQALQLGDRGLAASENSEHSYTKARALYWNAVMHQFRRDWPRVHDLSEGAIGAARENGLTMVVAVGRIMQNAAAAALGSNDGEIEQIRTALDEYRATGARFHVPYHFALLAAILRDRGEMQAGLDILGDALIHRLKGEILATESGPAAAEACYLQALAIAREQQAKSLELRAATSLAGLWAGQDEAAKARDLLAPVYDWFTEGFDTPDLKEAKALLDELA